MRKNLITLGILAIAGFLSGNTYSAKARHSGLMPEMPLYDIHGKHTTLKTLSKGKVTFIDNWFIPCPPCFREMGMLHKLYFKYKSNPVVNFMTICRTDTSIVKRFLNKDKSLATFVDWYESNSGRKDFKLPIYFIPGCNEKIYTGVGLTKYAPDDKTQCPDVKFKFHGYPTIVIYDKTGKLIYKRTGFGLNENANVYMAKLDSVIKSAM
ncbi:MAG: redoxin family protein [Bacteroidetes bacterium]|nr:redoxin family protein [Bacteroidota bacterium]